MFGLSKSFIIVLVIALLLGFADKNWKTTLLIIGIYALVKIVWKILTE